MPIFMSSARGMGQQIGLSENVLLTVREIANFNNRIDIFLWKGNRVMGIENLANKTLARPCLLGDTPLGSRRTSPNSLAEEFFIGFDCPHLLTVIVRQPFHFTSIVNGCSL